MDKMTYTYKYQKDGESISEEIFIMFEIEDDAPVSSHLYAEIYSAEHADGSAFDDDELEELNDNERYNVAAEFIGDDYYPMCRKLQSKIDNYFREL